MAASRTPDRVASLTPAQSAAWRTFLEVHARTTDLLERELRAEQGLTLATYDVLVQLSEVPDARLRMQELAARVLLSKSGLTRLVDRMEAQGLVRRVSCPSDARGTLAELTAAGRACLDRTSPTHVRGILEHFAAALDDEDAAQLAALLARVADAQRPSSDTGCGSDDGRGDAGCDDA